MGCEYCFASARGGYRGAKGLQTADAASLRRRLERLEASEPRSLVDEFMAARQPVHFGGMSDPFPAEERRYRVSRELLEVLAEYDYPTVISTKGDVLLDDDYLELLRSRRVVVQVSFSTLDDDLARAVEVGAPSPTRRLEVLSELAAAGVPTACRHQPILPTRELEADYLIQLCGTIGVRHFAVEHLKLPLEESARISRLSAALNVDLRRMYRQHDARRIGREWILPVDDRIETVLRLRARCHEAGMSFGAADNDLLLLSDGDACCSGIDRIWPSVQPFQHNYLGAARRRGPGGVIRRDHLDDVWCPTRSAGNVVNSRSRLAHTDGSSPGIGAYIDANWNGRANGNSPLLFAGVRPTGVKDDCGFEVYAVEPAWARLYDHADDAGW
jgi:DNA repair photolyase